MAAEEYSLDRVLGQNVAEIELHGKKYKLPQMKMRHLKALKERVRGQMIRAAKVANSDEGNPYMQNDLMSRVAKVALGADEVFSEMTSPENMAYLAWLSARDEDKSVKLEWFEDLPFSRLEELMAMIGVAPVVDAKEAGAENGSPKREEEAPPIPAPQ